jgi:hypothetical protein
MEMILIAVVLFGAGYAIAAFRAREKFKSEMKYQGEMSEYERHKTLWSYAYTAKRMGLNIESEEWHRILQEEQEKYDKTTKRPYRVT